MTPHAMMMNVRASSPSSLDAIDLHESLSSLCVGRSFRSEDPLYPPTSLVNSLPDLFVTESGFGAEFEDSLESVAASDQAVGRNERAPLNHHHEKSQWSAHQSLPSPTRLECIHRSQSRDGTACCRPAPLKHQLKLPSSYSKARGNKQQLRHPLSPHQGGSGRYDGSQSDHARVGQSHTRPSSYWNHRDDRHTDTVGNYYEENSVSSFGDDEGHPTEHGPGKDFCRRTDASRPGGSRNEHRLNDHRNYHYHHHPNNFYPDERSDHPPVRYMSHCSTASRSNSSTAHFGEHSLDRDQVQRRHHRHYYPDDNRNSAPERSPVVYRRHQQQIQGCPVRRSSRQSSALGRSNSSLPRVDHGVCNYNDYDNGNENQSIAQPPLRTQSCHSLSRPVEIEIMDGVMVPLRGSAETQRALETGFLQDVTCVACDTQLVVISDAEFVLCPGCKVVSPVQLEKKRSPLATGGGVGLGVEACMKY